MAVVLEFPWFTTFVIKVITAERSDAGAEEAADTLKGVTGGGGNWEVRWREKLVRHLCWWDNIRLIEVMLLGYIWIYLWGNLLNIVTCVVPRSSCRVVDQEGGRHAACC